MVELLLSIFLLAPPTPPPSAPIFVDNLQLKADLITGIIILPSIPNPLNSIHLFVNGVRQTNNGFDYTCCGIDGKTITPIASKVTEFSTSVIVIADYRR